jgi:hypothetical protein
MELILNSLFLVIEVLVICSLNLLELDTILYNEIIERYL